MTSVWAQTRCAQVVHRLWPARAPAWCTFAFALATAPAAQAGAWDVFVARCLDAYEHQTLPVVDGLNQQPVDQMHDAIRVFGPDESGLLVVLDAAPRLGERTCSVSQPGAQVLESAYRDWVADVTARETYLAQADLLVSNQWIEPQVHVVARLDGSGATYTVVETDLES